MKRAASEEADSQKRSRAVYSPNTIFDDANLKRSATDVLKNGTDGSGYLCGRFYMIWKPVNAKLKTIVETIGDDQGPLHRQRFQVLFTGKCADFFSELDFKATDQVMLALKGATVRNMSNIPHACTLGMELHYTEGVVVKFGKDRQTQQGGIRMVDTWELMEAAEENEVDWFQSPKQLPVPPLSTTSQDDDEERDTPAQPAPLPSKRALSPHSSRLPTLISPTTSNVRSGSFSLSAVAPHKDAPSRLSDSTADVPSTPAGSSAPSHIQVAELPLMHTPKSSPAPNPPPQALLPSKKKRRLEAKRQRSLATSRAEFCNDEGTSTNGPAGHRALPTPLAQTSPSITPPHQHPFSATTPDTSIAAKYVETPRLEPSGPPVLKAGLSTGTEGKYHALDSLSPGRLVHLIGIVVQATSTSLSRTSDWQCSFRIIDPSNITNDNLSVPEGFQVHCFTKKYQPWLPQPNLGEVLILRDVKTTEFYGNTKGVGYNDKLRWAVYSPTTREVRHNDLGDAPLSEGLADGCGYQFTPFFQPGESEIKYCQNLADWWDEVKKKREEAMGQVFQVGGGTPSGSAPYTTIARKHRLICEAGPDAAPHGYFDCTVEVLHGFMHETGVYSLYVTDYTTNSATMPVQADWCPIGLADLVLKVEMWDAAAAIGQKMLAGDYYLIKNARMKLSRGGYVEAKLVEQKTIKLEAADTDHDPYLKALLERKKAWQGTNNSAVSFEYRQIEDVVEGEFFACVVEVLHSVYDGDGTSCLYVTDYTSRSELLSTSVKESWSHGLDGRIVKITLWDQQIEMAKSVEAGSYCSIKKLRLKQSTTGRQFHGRLGGPESLVHMLNPKNTTNENLNRLIQRKEQWKQKLLNPDGEPQKATAANSMTATAAVPSDPARAVKYHTIEDIKASAKCPNKFRVVAKIIDFFPLNLVDCIVSYCANCKADIPSNRRACFDCLDTEHEHVRHLYQLFFLLQDEDGSKLQISVNDDCPVFEGLKRTDIRADPIAYRDLCQRLDPILGNLADVHANLKDKLVVAPTTPSLTLIIDTWEAEGTRAYCLAKLEESSTK